MTTQNEARSTRREADAAPLHGVELSEPTRARPLRIGDGFEALSFKHEHFGGLMDPLVMVDHFTMTEPIFGAHPHAGMSAVSVLPHVPGATMPVIEGDGHRVRVVLGETQGVVGAASPALPLTILDVQLEADGGYIHDMPASRGAWLHAVRGDAVIRIDGRTTPLSEGEAIALRSGSTETTLEIHSSAGSQVVLLEGTPIDERFVQQGPLVMSTCDEVRAVAADYAAGRLGSID